MNTIESKIRAATTEIATDAAAVLQTEDKKAYQAQSTYSTMPNEIRDTGEIAGTSSEFYPAQLLEKINEKQITCGRLVRFEYGKNATCNSTYVLCAARKPSTLYQIGFEYTW